MTDNPSGHGECDWLRSPAAPVATDDAAASDGADRRARHGRIRRGIGGALALVLAGTVGGAALSRAIWRPSSASSATPAASGQAAPASGWSGNQGPSGGSSSGTGGTSGTSTTGDGPTDAAAIAARVDDAIVDINVTAGYDDAQAAGTGMVLTSNGEILTNNHVISGATSISVTDVGNGQTYAATVVGYDKSEDVAVLQLSGARGLATISTASSPVAVGAGVVGIGNAGGNGGTPSYAGGVVSAVDQTITASDASSGTSERLTGLLETNANIVAGDSGGPLVDAKGDVVGMDTAGSAGFTFDRTAHAYAIPIATALDIARQIEDGQASGTVHIGPTAMLGVEVRPSGRFGEQSSGAVVSGVLSGGPADAAGLHAGDAIVSLAGHAVTSADDLGQLIGQQRPGSAVSIEYVDSAGSQHTTTARLRSGPPQ